MKFNNFPFFKQIDAMDCGPASLKIISKFYGKDFTLHYLREKFNIISKGVSLKQLCDVCDIIGLKNLPVKVSYQDLVEKIPMPCIINWNSSHFVVIYKIENDIVYVSDPQVGLVQYSKEEFITSWNKNEENGVVLVIETSDYFYEHNEVVEETKKNSKINKAWITMPLIFILFLSYRQWQIEFSIYQIFYSLLSFIGLLFSILIMQENLGLNNKFTAKICGGSTSTSEGQCKTVLSDKASFIYKKYTFSDLALIFFITLSCLSIFSNINTLYFIVISVISIPIIIYTFFYQMLRIKKWCRLCLSISLVLVGLIATTVVSFKDLNLIQFINSTIFFTLSLCFFLVVWINLKPFIYGYVKFKKKHKKDKRVKNNFAVFTTLLNITSKIDTNSLNALQKIEIGDKAAKAELSLFLSPKCIYCYKTFEEAFNLYEKHKGKFKLSIYLNVNLNNEKNNHRIIAETIMEKYKIEGAEIALRLLKEWYIDKVGLADFINKYKINISDNTRDIIACHFKWCNDNSFDYSPVKLFNKKVFPNEYEISDLKFFINEFEKSPALIV